MATQVLDVPGGIHFAGFYYPEIMRELFIQFRLAKEEMGLTDENENEPHVQFMRSFSYVGHLNNARLDMLATELFLDSAQLLQSVKAQLRLVGVELKSAAPAVAEIICKLSEITSADQTEFVPGLAEFATEDIPPITYEASEDGLDLDRTDQVSYVYGMQYVEHGSGYVNSATPDIFYRDSGSWPTYVVGKRLFVTDSLYSNGGEFQVVERINPLEIRVVRVPSSQDPRFQSEGSSYDPSLSWVLRTFNSGRATEANTDGVVWTAWSGSLLVGDLLYVGHKQVMMTQLDFTLNTGGEGAGFNGVWEYPDRERSLFHPSGVVEGTGPDSGRLIFDLSSMLLEGEDLSGAEIKIKYIQTGAEEIVTSYYDAPTNKAKTNGLLGQVSPSTDLSDYYITADWIPFPNIEDTTRDGAPERDMVQEGYIGWDLPQDRERGWMLTEVNGVEAYWARYRITVVSTPSIPVFDRIKMTEGDQYISLTVTQGESVGPQVVGASTGQANQVFRLPDYPYLDDTEVIEVDEGGVGTWTEWTRVNTFLSSGSTSRHYTRSTDSLGRASVQFGDGNKGKIPPAGLSNVRASYRIGGEDDGNVGADQITSNQEGVGGISSVFNPRPATGWRVREGSTEADLARVKRDSPAEVRTRGTAAGIGDVERLAVDFADSNGSKPVYRAFAEEEGYGAKTIKLIVVGSGGATLTTAQLEELEDYFNGDRYAIPPVRGVLVANHRLTAINYEPALVEITATAVWRGGNSTSIRNALLAYLTPLAVEDDGVTYIWNFKGQVSESKIHSIIHAVDPNITEVRNLEIKINGVVSPALGSNELPVTTAASLTINIMES